MTSEGDSETMRLRQADAGEKAWRRWGPYLSERQWGTVREDYSANGDAWAYLLHEARRARMCTGGARTVLAGSATISKTSASASPSGTAKIRS